MLKTMSSLLVSFCLLLMSANGHAADVTSIINIYDANGNLVTGDGRYYEYNDANQLVRVHQGDVVTGPVVAEYFYDSAGQRVKKIENGVVSYYIGKHYEKQVGGSDAGSTSYYFGEGGERLAKKDPKGDVYYYHLDHLDGVNAVTKGSDGTVVARADYLPFGDVRAGGSGAEKYTYTGKEQDKTGLYYFEARYNSSEFRHFTQADIADPDYGDPQDLNRYAYVGNNPLSYIDPDGFKKKKKAKLSKREKWMIAHGVDPDHDKTTLKKAKKQYKEGKKYLASISSKQNSSGHGLTVGSSKSNSAEGDSGSDSSKSSGSHLYSAEEIRNIWIDDLTNRNCGMSLGHSEQKLGCDHPADMLNLSPEALQCCAVHDQCYATHRCNETSWFDGCGSCQECNMVAFDCIERAAKKNPKRFVIDVWNGM